MQYDTDEQLIDGFQQGDRDAFTAIYYRFHVHLFHFAQRFVTKEEARDAVADAFVTLWGQRANFDAVPKIERWLFNTVRYQCLGLLRRQVRLHDAKAVLLHQLKLSEVSDLFTEELATELVKLLYQEIERLPPRQQEVFKLSFEQGLKPAEIARQLSLSVKTVDHHKAAAIRFLQAVLGSRTVVLHLLVLLSEEYFFVSA